MNDKAPANQGFGIVQGKSLSWQIKHLVVIVHIHLTTTLHFGEVVDTHSIELIGTGY